MSRFRSLRWRLTFLYLGLLAVLLLAGGVAQYFAAREVLFRTNADVLASEYNAVFTAFRKANGSRPVAVAQLAIPTSEIDQTLRADRLLAIVGSLLVLLVAGLLSPLIVARALHPLHQMSTTAGALAAGDYKQRVTVPKTRDEIGTLAVAFNQMAAGIDHAFEVRRRSEEQMRHFVADASHELRTPLTSLAGYIDVLGRREVVDAETLQASLAAMQQESARMTRLVNDLLTLTRFESGKAPSRQPLQLHQFVNQALNDLSLPDRGAVESRDIQPGVTVTADPDALKQE